MSFHHDVHFNIFKTKLDFQSMEMKLFHGSEQWRRSRCCITHKHVPTALRAKRHVLLCSHTYRLLQTLDPQETKNQPK